LTGRERRLDVRELPAPEPLERVIAALENLGAGEVLMVLLRREPWPLFPILADAGFDYLMRMGAEAAFEVLIWRRGDGEARAAAGP
jgi:hypothetical protein